MVVIDEVNLPEPLPGHPNESLLWGAKKSIQTIDELSEKPDIKNAFVKRLEEYRAEIVQASMPIQTTGHSIAFMGDIGVGKTTALCRIVGLEAQAENKATPDPVLEIGAAARPCAKWSLCREATTASALNPGTKQKYAGKCASSPVTNGRRGKRLNQSRQGRMKQIFMARQKK